MAQGDARKVIHGLTSRAVSLYDRLRGKHTDLSSENIRFFGEEVVGSSRYSIRNIPSWRISLAGEEELRAFAMAVGVRGTERMGKQDLLRFAQPYKTTIDTLFQDNSLDSIRLMRDESIREILKTLNLPSDPANPNKNKQDLMDFYAGKPGSNVALSDFLRIYSDPLSVEESLRGLSRSSRYSIAMNFGIEGRGKMSDDNILSFVLGAERAISLFSGAPTLYDIVMKDGLVLGSVGAVVAPYIKANESNYQNLVKLGNETAAKLKERLMRYGTVRYREIRKDLESKGTELKKSEKLDEAELYFRVLLTAEPESINARYHLGTIEMMRGSLEIGLNHLVEGAGVASTRDNVGDTCFVLGKLVSEGKYNEAKRALTVIVSASSEGGQRRFRHILTAIIPTQTVETTSQASRYHSQAKTELRKGRYDSAIESFQISILLNPKNAQACYDLGLAYLKTGQFEDSAAMLGAARRLDTTGAVSQRLSQSARNFYELGTRQDSEGKHNQAARSFRSAAVLDPFTESYKKPHT